MEAKPEELGKLCSNRKDVSFYDLQFYIRANFLSVQPLRRYDFKKIVFVKLFFLSTKIVTATHITDLMEAKPEKLDNICPNRKDAPFYALQFCIHKKFL